MTAVPGTAFLACHPATPTTAVNRLQVCVVRPGPGELRFRYRLEGEPARLRIPPRTAARRADELWKHMCFEAFVRLAEQPGYRELNFSPSSEWAAYAFEGYRCGMKPIADFAEPRIRTSRSARAIELQATIRLEAPAGTRCALSAVIEEIDGTLSYWALWHPAARPDFHHPNAFAFKLPT